MRLSTILELLLIFLLIAFAAYGRVIERDAIRAISKKSDASLSLKQTSESLNKYCTCNENICNCCRDFQIPLVQLAGPGCASLQYLQDDKLAMQLSIGDNILSSNVINGKNPKPVCVTLPGRFSKFCGKIYSIKREADKHFKACLGLELRSATELEASLRVSCFRFGPDGLKLRPAEPLPSVLTEPSTAADDDYDDIFGLDDDEDDDDEDDDDYEKVSPESNVVSGSTTSAQQDTEQEDDEDDLLGFSALFDIFTGDDDSSGNKKTKVTTSTTVPPAFAIPILSLTSTLAPISNEFPVSKKPVKSSASVTTAPAAISGVTKIKDQNGNETIAIDDTDTDTTYYPTERTTKANAEKLIYEDTTSFADLGITETTATDASNKIIALNKIIKLTDKIKLKKIKIPNKKKINAAAQNTNTINNNIKPSAQHQNINANDDLDDEYDYSDSDEETYESEDSNEENVDNAQAEKVGNNESDKHADDEEADTQDDDDYEEDEDHNVEEDEDEEEEEEEEEVEDAILSAIVDDQSHKDDNNHVGNKNKKKIEKSTTNKTADSEDEEADYSIGLEDLLARKQSPIRTENDERNAKKGRRQSKVMRF